MNMSKVSLIINQDIPYSTAINKFNAIDYNLRYLIGNGNKNFIIYPFGQDGMLTKQILNQRYGINELCIVDNQVSKYNTNIMDANYLSTLNLDNTYILVSTSKYEDAIIKSLTNLNISIEKVITVLNSRYSMEFLQKKQPFSVGKMSWGKLTISNNAIIKSIGSFSMFGDDTYVVGNHPNFVTTHSFPYTANGSAETTSSLIDNPSVSFWDYNKKVIIGNDVWCGRNVIIHEGVTIGNGAIIGSSAVVTKDIPDYAVAVGVPAKIIKYRFSPEQIVKINDIKWWDWDLEKIKECYADFLDIDLFLKKHS